MKLNTTLFIIGLSAAAITCACHKKAAVATPPPPPPAATHQAPATPAASRPTTVASSRPSRATTPVATAATHRRSLQDLLNELQDPYYDYDRASLRTDAVATLNRDSGTLKSLVQEFQSTKFVLEGQCDERGSAEYNLALGDRRAKAAKDFLTQVGVPADRLSVISYGKEHPVCNDHNEGCWQKNRRTHVTTAN